MRTTFFFHQMKSNKRLQEYASKKITEKVEKFVTKLIDIRIAFDCEATEYKMTTHIIGGDGFVFHIKTRCDDPFGCVDLLLEKLDRVLVRQKDKIKSHRVDFPLKHAHLAGKLRPQETADEIDFDEYRLMQPY